MGWKPVTRSDAAESTVRDIKWATRWLADLPLTLRKLAVLSVVHVPCHSPLLSIEQCLDNTNSGLRNQHYPRRESRRFLRFL